MIRCSSRRRRLLPALLAGLTAVGVLTSCSSAGDAPTEPELGPGVAAVVGDQVVSSDLLAERVRTAASDLAQALDAQAASQGRPDAPLDSATLADQSRELLTTAVLHEVIAEASRREGIVVPPAEVDAQVVAAGGEQAAAGSGYDLATLRELVSDQIAVAEIGRREFDRLAVTVDIGTFGSRPDAERAAARLATDPGTGVLDALPPQARVVDATLRPGTVQPGEPVSTASSLVFGLPGRTVSISGPSPASPGSTDPDPTMQPWTVVRVRDRSLAAPPPGADTVPASLVDASTMTQFGLRAIQPVSLEMGVRVNPRYGTWDPTQERVAAPPGAAGTVAPLQVAVPFAPPGKVLAPPAPPAPTSPGPTSPGPRSPGPAAPAPAPSPAPAP